MSAPPAKDLVILTADKNAQFALRGLLTRHASLHIRQLQCDWYVHPEKDPGVFRKAHDFLRPFIHSHARALIVMDREGSGVADLARETMEERMEKALAESGWQNRAAAIVIEPELEIWVWSDSPHVDTELGWTHHRPALRPWLHQQGYLQPEAIKPGRPKEALEAALRVVRLPRSSSIYENLAKKVSLARCTDPAFLKLKFALAQWFPKSS